MTTKVELVSSAYSQIRISGLTIDPSPEDTALALHRLEDMMAELYGRTVDIGYNFEEKPDQNSESGVPREHKHMVATNLGVRLCPDFGKDAPPLLINQANASMSSTSAIVARDRLRQVAPPSRMPVGSGNSRANIFKRFNSPTVVPVTDASNVSMYQGDIGDYSEDFSAFLSGDTIASYTIATTTNLTVITDALNTDKTAIDYRLQAVVSTISDASTLNSVVIVVTTTDGRIETRIRTFEIDSREIT